VLPDFMLRYGAIVTKLSELLGKKFVREEDFETPIGKALKEVIQYRNSGKYEERDYELARLEMLVKHLEEIKQYDENVLNSFRRKINRDDTNYYGFRFEVAITASLIRKEVNFGKSESPDFKIQYVGQEIFIECTSRHLSKPSTGDLKHKIEEAISKKSEKDYCQPNTALFIDITNIYYHSLLRGQLIDGLELKEYVGNLLEASNFGSVVLFTYILNKELNRFELDYLRADSSKINPAKVSG